MSIKLLIVMGDILVYKTYVIKKKKKKSAGNLLFF